MTRWPEFHGGCLLRGLDPLTLPLPSLLNVIYAWWTNGATTKEAAKFNADLWAPPAHLDPDETPGWSDEETLDAFSGTLAILRQQTNLLP